MSLLRTMDAAAMCAFDPEVVLQVRFLSPRDIICLSVRVLCCISLVCDCVSLVVCECVCVVMGEQVAMSLQLPPNSEIYEQRKTLTAAVVAKRSESRSQRETEKRARERARLEQMRRDAPLLRQTPLEAVDDENVIDL